MCACRTFKYKNVNMLEVQTMAFSNNDYLISTCDYLL